MQLVAGAAHLLVYVAMLVLLARLVIDWITAYARDYRPRGIALVVFETVYTLTDPPVRALRRWIPPLRIGGLMLDLSLMILLLVCWILLGVLGRLL